MLESVTSQSSGERQYSAFRKRRIPKARNRKLVERLRDLAIIESPFVSMHTQPVVYPGNVLGTIESWN